ncbi:MAG: MotA/TolQ/ExbB proton channel family protein [Candidatus Firestonebacteria bacterium]
MGLNFKGEVIDMFEGISFFSMLAKGGWTMVVLGVCSIISIAVIVERIVAFLNATNKKTYSVLSYVKNLIEKGDISNASNYCKISKASIGKILNRVLNKFDTEKSELIQIAYRAIDIEVMEIEKNLGILGTIGAVAPFIGLFGTVLGIIRAFKSLAIAEAGGPAVVSEGIAEALVTTAAGLFVAVISVVAYNYFVRRAKRIATQFENSTLEIIDTLK